MRRVLTSLTVGFAVALHATSSRAAPTDASAPAPPAQPAPVQPPSDIGTDARPGAKADRIGKRASGFVTIALGMPGLAFVNELVGARFDLEYTPRFAFGMGLAYANLKGKDGRVSNALPEVSFGYYAPLGDSFGIPVRFSGGYLPKNGPTARVTSGLSFSFNEKVSLELALVEPMVWVARDRPELSFNLGAALLGRF